MKICTIIIVLIVSVWVTGCQEPDEMPPILTLNGEDSVASVLNEQFDDPGATATDDVDGNLNSNIFTESDIDINKVGYYSIIYKVIDQAGNLAPELTRTVEVINTAEGRTGNYSVTDLKVYPDVEELEYNTEIFIDSTLNNRLIISNIGFNMGEDVFADITDTVLIIPYQHIEDSVISFDIQGSGLINDTLILIDYTLIDSIGVILINAELLKSDE
ncbi:MAG: DUF5011 domain-containing protein [Bacteroidales bacterium]|nr:DUF5011 domain-containing protein [Bacteroidales bacterium]